MSSIMNTPNETGQQQMQQQYNDVDQPSRDVESASITSSDISPIMDILLHETLLDRNDNDSVDANKLSRRVWEDVKRRTLVLIPTKTRIIATYGTMRMEVLTMTSPIRMQGRIVQQQLWYHRRRRPWAITCRMTPTTSERRRRRKL
jgi:hypothetical protein